MLISLHIKNYALIEDLEAEFGPGLNIITGETGAGKSIIIDALSLILGERADTAMIRKGAEKAIVEGTLAVGGDGRVRKLLAEHEIEHGDDLILRRELSVKGQSRCFINDTPAPLALLKQIGDLLVDLHGQHEHQSLLRRETHCDLLDTFGGRDGLVTEFGTAFDAARELLGELAALRARERELQEKRSFYEFQVKEIDAVGPRSGEEAGLEAEAAILENAERLYTATERLYGMLYEGEDAVHDRLVIIRNELEHLAAIDKSFAEAGKEAASAGAIVGELAKFIQGYNSRIEFSPERLEDIRNRLGQLALLRKKYGGSLEEVLRHREHIGRELEIAANFDGEIASLVARLDAARRACSEIAQRLSTKRFEVARKINRAIIEALKELGIPHGQFEAKIEQIPAAVKEEAVVSAGKRWVEATRKGMDNVEFLVSTNPGEDCMPLVKVASGGEISRIMLALKMVLAKSDRLPLLIFDEIDVGVSGRIAQAVGRSMKKLSQFHQLIAITHLPQIAGFADAHYVVEKVESNKRSVTRLRRLDEQEQIAEVARLISGEEVTEAGMASARELIRDR